MSDKLQQAISLIKSGDKKRGKHLIGEVIKEDPENETAWLWMYNLVAQPEKKQFCLERALAINPENQKARKALANLKQSSSPQVKQQPQLPQKDDETASSVSAAKISAKSWIIAIAILIVGIFGLTREVFRTADEISLQSNGEITQGIIVDSYSVRNRRAGRTYYVAYNYQSNNGQTYQGKEDVPEAEWNNLQSNPNIQVLYLPSNPGTSRIFRSTSDMSAITGLLFNYCCFGILLLLGILLIFGYVANSKNKKAA